MKKRENTGERKDYTVSSEVNMAEGGGIVEEEPAVWENNLQEQRDEVKHFDCNRNLFLQTFFSSFVNDSMKS